MNSIVIDKTEEIDSVITNFLNQKKNKIYKVAFSYLNNKYDVEDVISDTILIVYEKYGSLRDKTKFEFWFIKILINQCRLFHRDAKKKEKIKGRVEDYTREDNIEDKILIEEVLNKLPVKYKEVIVLKFFGDYSEEDISRTLNISKGTVKSRTHRAIKKLNGYMLKEGLDV